ncbi:MAG: hypothetical protein AAF664_12895 [Planctomycetota bacterium]
MTQEPYQPPHFGQLDQPVTREPALKHSSLGITSFVIAILAGIGIFALVLAAGVMEASTPGGIDDESSQAMIIGLGIIGGVALNLLGTALGIGSLFQRNRSKIFGIIGLALNLLIMIGIVSLIILGLSVDG